jgi:trans-aconitate methyltransferase
MIDTALSLTGANLSFELMDATRLEYENEFDLVFSNAALHWVTNHNAMLEGVYRSLKPGGRVRFNFAGQGNCENFFRVVREAIVLAEYRHYFTDLEWPWFMPDPAEYRQLVRKFPFSEVHVWGGDEDTYFPDAQSVTAWVDQPSLVPILGYVDDKDKQTFRDLVVERLLAATIQEDGTYLEPFKRINLLAIK